MDEYDSSQEASNGTILSRYGFTCLYEQLLGFLDFLC